MIAILTAMLVASLSTEPVEAEGASGPPQEPAGTTTIEAPSRVQQSPFTDNAFPTLLRDLNLRPTDLLEASLSVEDRGAKLGYAPFLYGLVNYMPVISETRFTLSQSNGITTMGVGAVYDPASPRSKRGTELWEKGAPTTVAPLPYVNFLRRKAGELSAAIAPLVVEFDGASNERREVIAREVADMRARATAMLAEADRVIAADTRAEAKRIMTFYEGLLETKTPMVSASFTTSLFSILGGTRQDANNNGRGDTELKVKGRALTLAADIPFRSHLERKSSTGASSTPPEMYWRWLQFSAAVTTEWQRSSQEEGTPFGRLFGFGITGGGIIKILNNGYENTADYKDSFFIPSLSAGASFERKECTSSAKTICPDGIDNQSAFTPFLDVKLSKAAQFRIGVPLKFTHKVAGDKTRDLGIVGVYALQLGAPK